MFRHVQRDVETKIATKSIFSFVVAIASLLSGCATAPSQQKERVGYWEMPPSTSAAMVSLRWKDGTVAETVSGADLDRLRNAKLRLERVAPLSHVPLLLSNAQEPDAFASDREGSFVVVVSASMLRLVQNDEDAMAALLGHEYAHLIRRHGPAQQPREETRRKIKDWSWVGGLAGAPLINTTAKAVTTAYSRDQEREADADGIRYAIAAGFDPWGAVRLQEKLGTVSQATSLSFLSTHPQNAERIENMRKLAAATGKAENPSSRNPPPKSRSNSSVQPPTTRAAADAGR